MSIESSLPALAFAVSAGMVLGLVYFLILWASLQRLSTTQRPGRLMLFSYMARLLPVLAGFYLVMDHRWERVAAALAGFLIARSVLTRVLGRREPAAG